MKLYLFSFFLAIVITLLFSIISHLFTSKKPDKVDEFIIRTETDFFKVDVNTIMYAENASDAVLYHLSDKEDALSCPQTFDEAKKEFKRYPHFILPNDTHIVNAHHISNISNSTSPQLVMYNGDTIPMPREKYSSTADALLKHGRKKA